MRRPGMPAPNLAGKGTGGCVFESACLLKRGDDLLQTASDLARNGLIPQILEIGLRRALFLRWWLRRESNSHTRKDTRF